MRATNVRKSAAAWAKILQFVQARKRTLAGKGEPIRWKWQELYEEREANWFKPNDGN
jgi:hypothetical protein